MNKLEIEIELREDRLGVKGVDKTSYSEKVSIKTKEIENLLISQGYKKELAPDTARSLFNLAEDRRLDRLMAKKYPFVAEFQKQFAKLN